MDTEERPATVEHAAPVGGGLPGAPPPRRVPAAETLRLYASDWAAFVAWCRLAGTAPLPASATTVVCYLAALAERLSAGTVARRAAAIAAQHRQRGLASPASDLAVTTLLRQVRHAGTRRRARPPPAAQLVRMASACPGDLAGLRDRALLLLAAAGLGRTALVSLDAEQIHVTATGADLILHSQSGVDRTATVQRAAPRTNCPVRALQEWLHASECRFGPVFRKVDRWGNVEHRRLGTDAIRRILARRAQARLRRAASA
jgi:site-specific recombinase XerD